MVDTSLTIAADVEQAKESIEELTEAVERLNEALEELEQPPASMEIQSRGSASYVNVNWLSDDTSNTEMIDFEVES